MNALVSLNKFAAADDDGIFAPVSPDLLGALLRQYEIARGHIAQVAAIASGEAFAGVMHYFISGNCDKDGRNGFPGVGKMFNEAGAVAALNASYWQQALKLTDVYEMMPQKRRDEWNEQINKQQTPEFTADIVIPTIIDLLNMRPQFLAERVDGIFRALSHEHVTNCPQGFGKRMILYVLDSYGSTSSTNCGHVTDLRKVIAKFMGRDEPKGWNVTDSVVKAGLRRTGEWMAIDGGAMRIRVYQKGTAHLEIHPEMVWRLNAILAHLHPLAIPAEFRTKPKKKAKSFDLMQKPLPFAVISALSSMKQAYEPVGDSWRQQYKPIHNAIQFEYHVDDKHVRAEAVKVLEALGAVTIKNGWAFQFDYDYRPVLDEVVCSGCIPDQKSHQFYPTPANVAQAAIELAEIGPDHDCLEPSAGQGGLADLMTNSRTLSCVEVSKLHCEILKAKGHSVTQADFLSLPINGPFDRVAMNPPYSQGRWQAHTEHAASMVKVGGILVAILPASARNKYELEGFDCSWSEVFSNEFAGTSVSVAILKAVKK